MLTAGATNPWKEGNIAADSTAAVTKEHFLEATIFSVSKLSVDGLVWSVVYSCDGCVGKGRRN